MNSERKISPWIDRTAIISNVVTPLAAILTLFIAAFSSLSNLPTWFVYVPVFFLILSGVVFGGSKASPIRLSIRKRKVAKDRWAALLSQTQRFARLTSLQQNDTITYALRTLDQLHNRPFAELSHLLTDNLLRRLQTSAATFQGLSYGIHDLHALIHSYHRLYFIEALHRARTTADLALADEDKRIAEVARESFSRYVEDFQTFCDEVNSTLKTKEFDFFFEKAKPL